MALDPVAVRARAEEVLRRSREEDAKRAHERAEESARNFLTGEPDEPMAPVNHLRASAEAATAYHDRLSARRGPDQPAPRSAASALPVMTPEVQAGWDKWVKAHIRNALHARDKAREGMIDKGLVDAIGEALGTVRKQLREEMTAISTESREARGKLLARVMRLEAERDGRSLSRIYPQAEARHADAL